MLSLNIPLSLGQDPAMVTVNGSQTWKVTFFFSQVCGSLVFAFPAYLALGHFEVFHDFIGIFFSSGFCIMHHMSLTYFLAPSLWMMENGSGIVILLWNLGKIYLGFHEMEESQEKYFQQQLFREEQYWRTFHDVKVLYFFLRFFFSA